MTQAMGATVDVEQSGPDYDQAARVDFEPGAATWLTPGGYVAQAVAKHPEVRLVLQRLEQDRLAVFVVLDDDPEEVLDEIFEAERDLYTSFEGLPFDVRVMKPASGWSADDLLRDTITHYERPHTDGCQG